MKKPVLVFFLALLFTACGPAGKIAVKTAASSPEDLAAIQAAGASAARGSYLALRDACRIYGGLYAGLATREKVAVEYFRTVFLLALREKELGIENPATLQLAGRLVGENPGLAGYGKWVEAADDIPLRIIGVVNDSIPWLDRKVSYDEVDRLLADLFARVPGDELAAYFYLALGCPEKTPQERPTPGPRSAPRTPVRFWSPFERRFAPNRLPSGLTRFSGSTRNFGKRTASGGKRPGARENS